MNNPYKNLSPESFWKTGVASCNPLELQGLWRAKFSISQVDLVTTAGSCFAQHISRAMAERGFNWIDSEPLPPHLSEEEKRKYGYGVFSFRTGNIYTTALLLQWVEASFGLRELPSEIWERDGRYFDPLRPVIEPEGFASAEECLALRRYSLTRIRSALERTTLFVFTLGLTESWVNSETGLTYAACPGTLGGTFDPERHKFRNLTYPEIYSDLQQALHIIRENNPSARFLLTVSPVPLTATASGMHVLPATIYSKSVLRAVAGDLAADHDEVDYFPSFEIISSFPYKGFFFESNLREVARAGVDHVMAHFFAGIGVGNTARARPISRERNLGQAPDPMANDGFSIECEEALLEAFSK